MEILKRIFKQHYLINEYIENEYKYFGTDKYNEKYMNFLWDAKLNLHTRYIINITYIIILIIIILK